MQPRQHPSRPRPPTLAAPMQVGVLKARQLAAVHRLPLVPVHHMEAHALVARLGATRAAAQAAASERGVADSGAAVDGAAAAAATDPAAVSAGSGSPEQQQHGEPVEFPFLCLLISGGHNLLLLVEGVGQYTQLGTTLDDALGARVGCRQWGVQGCGGARWHCAATLHCGTALGWHWLVACLLVKECCLRARYPSCVMSPPAPPQLSSIRHPFPFPSHTRPTYTSCRRGVRQSGTPAGPGAKALWGRGAGGLCCGGRPARAAVFGAHAAPPNLRLQLCWAQDGGAAGYRGAGT